MIFPRCSVRRAVAACVVLLGGACLSCTAARAETGSASVQDSNALIMTAEIALRRDDCGRAAKDYEAAARGLSDARVAQRATDVAIGCGQYSLAEQAAARWRELRPTDPAPLHATMRAALGLYQIDVARSAFEHWLASRATQGSAAHGAGPGASAGGAGGAAGPAGAGRVGGIADELQQVADESGVAATLAMLQGVQVRPLDSSAGQLALANLAFDGWNYREALRYGERALGDGAARAATQLVLARAHAGLGEAAQAEAAASAARAAAPQEQSFAPADVLLLLGREHEAHDAIEDVLARDPQNAALRAQAERRLGLIAFDNGDYDEAQREFSALLNDRDSAAIAVYYLAAIAERRDDVATALRGYQLLAGTALEASARERAATLLFKHGHRESALQLLAAANDASPAARVDAQIEQAQLLSDGGEAPQALARIDDALELAPGHPDLLYQRAIVLEKGGHTDEAIAQLETLYRQRPQDGEIANALGFILADHGRELARAQRLISFALKGEPDNPAILDSMGWLYYRRGMPKAALPLLARAFRLDQDGDIGAHWGEVLWSLGQKAKAREAWSRALIADPDNAAVKNAEKRLRAPQLLTPGEGTSV
ncbi:MAG TPA: tetratricopeptide repeat protein [Steroidobacteraceae bacterium]|nr:tetratricopeptide repeat protein [Steroidobacteraceae bacterium]